MYSYLLSPHVQRVGRAGVPEVPGAAVEWLRYVVDYIRYVGLMFVSQFLY
jgi:hypothetical protein